MSISMSDETNQCGATADSERQTVNNPTSSGIVQVSTVRNYNLNINKTLRRKLESCELLHVDYKVTGGGITGCLDTASFELLQLACSLFYKELPKHEGRCVIDIIDDKKRRAVVQQT